MIIDGAVDAEVSYAYFAPTPFSNWQLSISAPGMDLSGVSSIVMDFAGSAIAQGQNAALGATKIEARRTPVVLENSAVASCETG